MKGIAFVELDAKDVVRHKLVQSIIYAYEQAEATKAQEIAKDETQEIKDL